MGIAKLQPGEDYIQAPRKIKGRDRRCARRHPLRLAAAALCAWTVLGGCATGPRLEPAPAPGESAVALTDAGIRFAAFPNTWSGYPGDLARYYTPLEIRIENARDDEVQIRFEDFIALDDGNRQYRAVPPLEVVRALAGAREPRDGGPPAVVAGPWYPHGRRYWWGPYDGPAMWPYAPWWFADPYYYPYGWPRAAVRDVLVSGLREGRLLAGASVQGFVYFQLATERGSVLTVSWTPRLSSGAGLAPLAARFHILR
jgi:hypothetical protein